MNSIFMNVKAAVTTRQAAEYYGFLVDRHGMMRCPFHDDTHPSMKVDERYYCFGCHETGDVIDFVSRVFSMTLYEAAMKLARDFGFDPNAPASAALPKRELEWQQRKDEGYCASVLIRYECHLKQEQRQYAPVGPDDPWDERFASACFTLPSVADLLDCLYSPDAELRKDTADALVKSGAISRVESILNGDEGEKQDVRPDAKLAA